MHRHYRPVPSRNPVARSCKIICAIWSLQSLYLYGIKHITIFGGTGYLRETIPLGGTGRLTHMWYVYLYMGEVGPWGHGAGAAKVRRAPRASIFRVLQ